MAAKKIQLQMTSKPTDPDYKKELVQKTLRFSIETIIAYAKEQGVTITKKYIYNTRWSIKRSQAKKMVAKKAPRRISKAKARPRKARSIVRSNGAPDSPLAATPYRNARRGASSRGTLSEESALFKLILRVGTRRSRELVDHIEADFSKIGS